MEAAPQPAAQEKAAAADSSTPETGAASDSFSDRAAIGETDRGAIKDPAADTFVIEPAPLPTGTDSKAGANDTEVSRGPANLEDNGSIPGEIEGSAGEPGNSQPTSVLSTINSFFSESKKYGAKFPETADGSGPQN